MKRDRLRMRLCLVKLSGGTVACLNILCLFIVFRYVL